MYECIHDRGHSSEDVIRKEMSSKVGRGCHTSLVYLTLHMPVS